MWEDYDDFNFDEAKSGVLGKLGGLPPYVSAALMFAIPFMVVDFFNYYSAGTALVLSTPLLAIFYTACGAVAGKLAGDRDFSPNFLLTGAFAGIILWLVSTVVNTITGIRLRSSFCLMLASTARPSVPGMFKSSRMMPGRGADPGSAYLPRPYR